VIEAADLTAARDRADEAADATTAAIDAALEADEL
jgi:hypothetical protein